jgi:uncharacterized protein YndB with AHSA1/START domain
MIKYGEKIGDNAFRIERLLPGPIERLWAFLTEADKRAQWFAGGQMDLKPGGTAAFYFQHKNLAPPGEPVPENMKQPSEGMEAPATVLKVEPPRLLVIDWDGGEVTFELTPRGGDVLMSITHTKLKDRKELTGIAGGWHTHLNVLADRLAGRERQPFWPMNAAIHAEYEKRIPPITKEPS